MLVLTRRVGEEIIIAGNICVTVVAAKGQRVRLGIAAPACVSVARHELLAGCSQGAAPRRLGRNAKNRQRRPTRGEMQT
jgi:carbon storage regulator